MYFIPIRNHCSVISIFVVVLVVSVNQCSSQLGPPKNSNKKFNSNTSDKQVVTSTAVSDTLKNPLHTTALATTVATKIEKTKKTRKPRKTKSPTSKKTKKKSKKPKVTEYPHLITPPTLNKTMRAAVIKEFGAPENFVIKELPLPEPGEKEVLVQVKAAGLNFVDTQMRSGQFSKLPPLPAILGKEAAGIIVKLGKKIKHTTAALGERVVCCFYGTGAYAEYVVCNVDHIVRFPDYISFHQASTLYVSYFTAFRALVQKAQAKPGEVVYIHGGTGGLGIAALQIAKSRGCKVVSTYGCPEGKDLLLKLGADYVHSHRETGHTILGYDRENLTGYDVILETVAEKNIAQSVFSLNPNGRLCIIGSKGTAPINPISLIIEEAEIHGVMLSKASLYEFQEAAIELMKGMSEGWLQPVVERVYKLEDIGKAHKDIEYKEKTLGKYVVEF